MQFIVKKLIKKNYTSTKIILTIKKIKLINRKKFAIMQLSLNNKTFIMYVIVLEIKLRLLVNLISKIAILEKYLDYISIFLPKFMTKHLKYNNNTYIIK